MPRVYTPFFLTMNKGAKLIADAIAGNDYRSVIINNKRYIINPPTIQVIAQCCSYLENIKEGNTLAELLASLKDAENIVKALSCMIQGDEGLVKELSKGTLDEVIGGLEEGLSLIRAENFIRLSVLTKSVRSLVAKQ